MSDFLLPLYHSLPYPLRCLAASVHGWKLRGWRYGKETDRLVEQALEREHWGKERWAKWQEERLEFILERAVTKVPYYREHWRIQKSEVRSRNDWRELRNWPVLKKEALRANPRAFLADDCNPRRMYHEHTSGSTGTPLMLFQSRDTLHQWYALLEARWRGWYGLSRQDRWAIIGGQLVVPAKQKEPPFWVWNAAFHQLYLSAYHVAPQHAATYVEAMKRHRVTFLWTYASSAHTLAQFILDQNLQAPELKVVIVNAEPLYDHQRETIAKAFRCLVVETYGMSELACAASECLHGRLHLWPEAGLVEVLDSRTDEPATGGTPGRLIATGLLNADMPLIRYEVGDTVVLADPDGECPCGRTLPILQRIEGRNDDVITTPDGRRIGRLDPVFKGGLPISEAQIVQESLGLLRVMIVPALGFTRDHSRAVEERLRERVGDIEIVVEQHKALPRSANGKLRSVVSRLSTGGPKRNGETQKHSEQKQQSREFGVR